MGIPRFFRFITEKFPNVYVHTTFKKGFVPIDNLYLDANGILHTSAYDIYFNKPSKPRLSWGNRKGPTRELTAAEKELKLFKAITDYMDQLLKFVKPRKLFYIAIDGPAPLAKQAQQRQRRYKSAYEKSEVDFQVFDSTCITPGTHFMHKLSLYLSFYIRKMISTDPAWQKVQIIYSGPTVAGEGEHKIVQYIREQPDSRQLIHCMYGLDADLFMLSLSTHCPKFYLLREDQFNQLWDDTLFYKVNIGLLRKEIVKAWGPGPQKRLIDDFIFICFLAGNDFLHALPACHDLQEAILYLMDLRRYTLNKRYLTHQAGFSLNNLAEYFKALAETEEASISAQFYRQNFTNLTLNSSLRDSRRPELGINLSKYRELYYKKAGIDHRNEQQVTNFCKEYIQGLEWVQSYYHFRPKNWHWYFPHHYSPLLVDLVKFFNCSKGSLSKVSNKEYPPILPFQQLLCVIPPRSKMLLPKYLQDVYKKLEKYYPEKFKIDLEGKIKDWEGIVILPFIPIQEVIKAYTQAIKRANAARVKTTYVRNRLTTTLLFEYADQEYIYKSNYGQIKNCRADCQEM